MALSYQNYTGDSVTTTFSIPFTYTSTSEISVTVDGVAQTGLTFPSASTVQLTSAPATSTLVQVRRTTNLTSRAVDYVSGSVLTEEDLDNANIQVFHASQEATDRANDAISLGSDNKWDAQSKVIKNVANPVADTDAVNKQFISTNLPNINTVAGIAANVTTVANNTANIAAVVADAADIGTVATNIASVNTVATNIADVITVANDLNEAISEIETAANDLNEAVSEIDTVANAITNVNTVGNNIGNVNTVAGISGNVTTVAGISGNVTTVAGANANITTVASNISNVNTVAGISANVTAVAADATDIGTVASNITNVNNVAANSANITSVAGNATNINNVASNATNINTVAGDISSVGTVAVGITNVNTVGNNIANVNTVAGNTTNINAVAADATDIGTVATNIANVNNVGGSIANVNTVASNLTNVNAFAETYFISATAPASPTTGDLWFDTSTNTMKVYTGSGFVNAGSSVNGTSERQTYTATGGQTTFAATYDAGYLDVYLNGVKLINGTDFTATNGTSVVLSSGAAAGDTVDIVAFGTFDILDVGGSLTSLGIDNHNKITVDSGGDISFYDSTGTSQNLFWDASAERLTITNSNNYYHLGISNGTSQPWYLRTDSSGKYHTHLNGTGDVFTIDTNGNVGIGTTSPSSLNVNYNNLVVGSGSGNEGITIYSGTSSYGGLIFADGTAGTAPYEGQLKYDHASNSMSFHTNGGTERMRLDSSGRLGIGTSSPTHKVDVVTDGGTQLRLAAWDLSSTARSNIDFWYLDAGGSPYNNAQISALAAGNAGNGNLVFSTRPTSGSLTERARIESNGDVRIGTGNGSNTIGPKFYGGGTAGVDNGLELRPEGDGSSAFKMWTSVNNTAPRSHIAFFNTNGVVGSITTSGSATAYNTSSDYRLKENVVELTGATDRIKQIPVHRFNFIADPDKTVDGFLAHEVADVVPEAITGEKDAMKTEEYEVTPAVLDDDGNVVTEAVMGTREVPVYQGIDQSKLVPLLTAALQEAIAKIETLETRISALGG